MELLVTAGIHEIFFSRMFTNKATETNDYQLTSTLTSIAVVTGLEFVCNGINRINTARII